MPHGNTSRQQRAIKRVEMTGRLTAIAIVSFTVNGLAQGNTHTFFFDDDLKQYAIETVPNYDAYAMAGTYRVTPGFSGDQFPSATLSLFIDKNTLMTGGMTPPQGTPFVHQYATGANTGNGEFGIGILPDPDGSGGFFVVGNDFYSDPNGIPSAGFKPSPQFYWLTYLDPNNGYIQTLPLLYL